MYNWCYIKCKQKMSLCDFSSHKRWIILVLLTVCVQTSRGSHERVLSVENCNLTTVVAGHPVTIQEVCGDNFTITAIGIFNDRERFPSVSFPWILEISLVTDEQNTSHPTQSSKNVTIEEAMLMGDDITYLVLQQLRNSPQFDVPAGKCDNRDGKGVLRLFSSQPFNESMEYISSGFVRVLCDFSGVDLVINKSESMFNIPTVIEAVLGGNTNLTSALGLSDTDDFRITLSGHVPMLEPEDVCIFAIAYLTKDPFSDGMDAVVSPEQCTGYSTLPHITYRDTLIGTPVCYRHSSGPVDLLDIVRSWDSPLNLCGPHVLVVQVDPMNTLHNEVNKCNNYVTFDVNFHCDPVMIGPSGPHGPQERYGKPLSHCEMHMNSFGDGLHDTRFTYHSIHYYDMNSEYYNHVVMFKQDGNRWFEVLDDYMGIQEEGLGLVKVFNRYLESINMSEMCDDLASAIDIETAISELEGIKESNDDDDGMEEFQPEYIEARNTMKEIFTSTNVNYRDIASDLRSKIDSIVTRTDDSSFNEMIQFRMVVSAYNTTAMIADVLSAGITHDEIKKHSVEEACMMSDVVEHLPHVLSMLNTDMGLHQTHGIMTVVDIIGNLSRVALSLHHFYPNFTCLQHNLKRLLNYVSHWEEASYEEKQNLDMEWLYDFDQVQDLNDIGEDKIQFAGCETKPNHCMKKFRTICNAVDQAEHVTNNLFEVRDNVCRARFMKQKAEEQYRILGFQSLKQKMIQEKMLGTDNCRKDLMAPQIGPLTLWKMEDEIHGQGHTQVVYKGDPTIDNHSIMWRKVAVCSCDVCDKNINRNTTRRNTTYMHEYQ